MAGEETPLAPGHRIDRYELLYAIARGGMGAVWAARLKGTHGFEKLYAIKTILPRFASDPAFRAMFLDEGIIASAIVHPNVAQVLDLGEHKGSLYMVLEWVDGDSLAHLTRAVERGGGTIPLRITLRILADVCAGLHAAHELCDRAGAPLDVVHRDVSPPNVLVSSDGIAKVIDFGVVKARNRISGETTESVIKGKVRFMAPEQLRGDTVDRRADLWSVGAMLFRMVTGKAPFAGESDFEVVANLVQANGPPSLPSDVAAPLADIVRQTLAPAPAERFPTARHLQAALEQVARDSSATATSADVAVYVREHTHETVRKRREAVASAMASIARSEEATGPAPSSPEGSRPSPAASDDGRGTSISATLDAASARRRSRSNSLLKALIPAGAAVLAVSAGTWLRASKSRPGPAPASAPATSTPALFATPSIRPAGVHDSARTAIETSRKEPVAEAGPPASAAAAGSVAAGLRPAHPRHSTSQPPRTHPVAADPAASPSAGGKSIDDLIDSR